MNKNELIVFLRDPSKLTPEHLNELEEIIGEDPYFLSAHLLLAKGSKELKDPKTKKRVASAAIYSTDRILLKKYLSSNLFFLGQAVAEESAGAPKTKKEKIQEEVAKVEPVKKVEQTEPRADKRPSALKNPPQKRGLEIPSVPSGELDSLLDELSRDMQNLKSSRTHFAEVQQKIEEEEAIAKAIDRKIEEKKVESEDKPAPHQEEKGKVEVSKPIEKEGEGSKIELDPKEEELFSKKLEALAKKKEEQKTDPEPDKEDKPAAAPLAQTEELQEDTTSNPQEEERAEKSIDEPRFSRFATRSYLKDLSADIDDDFDFFGDKKTSKDTKPQKEEPSQEGEKEESGKGEVKQEEEKKKTTSRSEDKTASVSEKREKKVTTRKSSSKTTTKTKSAEEEQEVEEADSKKKKVAPKKEPVKKTSSSTTTKKATPKTASGKKEKTTSKSTKQEKPAETKKVSEKKTTKKAAPRKKSTTTSKKDKPGAEGKDEGTADRASQQQIIDKFIKESPSIKYTRKDETSSNDLAETSSEWDTNLASEYLAEIYLHQGNKKRAKEIYEALVLKYPEKKSYFADLISKIE